MLLDPKVILKKQYLEKSKYSSLVSQSLGGDEWYHLQATRAFNQAIGRVIRHSQDYGSIILIDERFSLPQFKEKISKWMRDRLIIYENADSLFRHISEFFQSIESLNLTYRKELNLFNEDKLNPEENIEDDVINEDNRGLYDSETSDEERNKTFEISNDSSMKVDKSILKNSSFKRKTKRNSNNFIPTQFSNVSKHFNDIEINPESKWDQKEEEIIKKG